MSDTPRTDAIFKMLDLYEAEEALEFAMAVKDEARDSIAKLERELTAAQERVKVLEADADGLRQDAELFRFCVAHCAFPHVRWNGKEGYFGLEIDGAVYCGENARLAVMNAVGALQIPAAALSQENKQ